MRASLLVFFLLVPPALAQRNSAKLSFTDREVTVEYGVARLGKHTIAELPVGQEWRMGMNEASVLRTQLPLVAGDVVVAPGSYRAKLVRKSEKEIVLRLDGGAQALGAKGDLDLPGELVDAKPSELLAIEWNPAPVKGKKDAEFATKLLVHFGPQQVSVPIKVIGARPAKLAGALVDVFTFEPEWLSSRLEKSIATPVLAFKSSGEKKDKKGPDAFHFVLASLEKCSFVPDMVAPTDSFGFGEVKPPDADQVIAGTVQSSKSNATKPVLELEKIERSSKGELTVKLAIGGSVATATVNDPAAKAAAAKH